MGHLWKRDKFYYMGHQDRRGKWVQKSTRTTDKHAAKKRLIEAERKVLAPEEKALTIFLREYLDSKALGLSDKGQERYENCFSNIVHAYSPLASLALHDVDVAACSKYITWRLGHHRTKSTIHKEITWLKGAMDAAAEHGLIRWDQAYQLRRKKWSDFRGANKPRKRIIYPHEWEILLDASTGDPNLRDALIVALFTGLRRENILTLTEAQADFTCEPAVLRFSREQMKNQERHLVLLPERVRAILWNRWQGQPSRRFFVDFRTQWKRLQRQLAKAGQLEGFRFRDFRRSYATYRLAAGVDPKNVQEETGHLTARMVMEVYSVSLRDPAVREWGRLHFRFPWDDSRGTVTNVQEGMAKKGQNKGDAQLHSVSDNPLT